MLGSLAVIYDRHRRLADAEEAILAWMTIANETELVRRIPFQQLDDLQGDPFQVDVGLASNLDGAVTSVTVSTESPTLKRLDLTVRWEEGRRIATARVYRADTGGGNLW